MQAQIQVKQEYDFNNCQSLFGYARRVHERSGGVCQLCGCNAGDDVDFDLWRQFTVEHLIGESQRGYFKDIRAAVAVRFPDSPPDRQVDLARLIDVANTVSACSFGNSTTSRVSQPASMEELILGSPGAPEEVLQQVNARLHDILVAKRSEVAWKAESLRRAFEAQIKPSLVNARAQSGRIAGENRYPTSGSGAD